MLSETRWPVIIFCREIKNSNVLLEKCKLLFTKTVVFDDKTDVLVHSVELDNSIYNIVICSDCEMFSPDILRRLLLSSDGEEITAAAAISGVAEKLSIKAVFLSEENPNIFDACAAVFGRYS